MRYLLLLAFSFPTYGSIWMPHVKEIWTILRKAERTPEMRIELKYPGLEKISVDRAYEFTSYNCSDESIVLKGMSKIPMLNTDREKCSFY